MCCAALTHALTTDDIREPSEEQLTDEVTDGSSYLDTKILVRAQSPVRVVDVAKHRRGDVDGKDIVAVCGAMSQISDPNLLDSTHASVKKPTPATMVTLK